MTRPKREREEGRGSAAGEYPRAKRPRRDSLEEAEDDFARAQASLDRKRRQRQQPTQHQTSTMSEAHDFANVSADRLHRFQPYNERRHDPSSRPSSEDRDREIKPGPGSRPQNPNRGVYHDFAREGRDRPAPSRFDSPPQTQGSDRDQRPSYHSLTRGGGHGRGQSLQREPDVTSDRGQSHHPRRFTGTSFQPPQQICNKPPFHEKVKLNTEDAEKLVTHGGQSIDPHVELRCGNCGHRGHRLIDCIWPDLSGQISGCPLCNTKLHHLDECARVSQLSKAQLYNLLIHRRGNRPAIASRTPWVDLVMEAATASIGIKDPQGGPFPWTEDFAKSQGHTWCKYENRSGPLWEFYDYRAGKEGRMPLPTDPKTKNLEKVLSSVEGLRITEVHLGLGQNALTL
ncbi:hypothetical protein COL154_001685 [Colletotrichum chrysophilum]|uniref:uncharacterized protein n=1 Tax=Colletotrichum chrysophilum TaxID=1836956 RepID=UPI0023013894|nr:uncharacterized protein COL26b_000804 [Colletotrichum chrysophilum]KAJ0353061.1 hypothetical protein KNSL1_002255 [Colletotrichum chrysophilum]KAJ0369879.1 hypothetical protein COL154_001685 [Colletotrichum chrysophilum]KAJ0380964.1 hypothetical protein COL26b_000804 [Colletotrichum chrysophilum]